MVEISAHVAGSSLIVGAIDPAPVSQPYTGLCPTPPTDAATDIAIDTDVIAETDTDVDADTMVSDSAEGDADTRVSDSAEGDAFVDDAPSAPEDTTGPPVNRSDATIRAGCFCSVRTAQRFDSLTPAGLSALVIGATWRRRRRIRETIAQKSS